MSERNYCCDMHKKVVLRIDRIRPERECGVPESTLVDYHDFSYESKSNLKVAASLSFKFCPWCGTPRDDNDNTRRVVETIVSTG